MQSVSFSSLVGEKPSLSPAVVKVSKEKKEIREITAHSHFVRRSKKGGGETPSQEQADIISKVVEGLDVRVIAVAGSGKTTLSLMIYKNLPRNIILMTFNRKLKDETKKKVQAAGNCVGGRFDVYTYHGFVNKYLGTCRNDKDIDEIINSPVDDVRLQTLRELSIYNLLILDELQDMNDMFYRIIKDYILPYGTFQLMLLGDHRQQIYKSLNASSSKYLLDDEYWNRTLTTMPLSTSYRLTRQCATFVNEVLSSRYEFYGDGEDPEGEIQPFELLPCPGKEGPQVSIYWMSDYDKRNDEINRYKIVWDKIREYGKENVLIMSYSVKPGSDPLKTKPLVALVNRLSDSGIDIEVLNSDYDGGSDDKLTKGKLVVSSFHKQKGCEYECVIILNLDKTFHDYYQNGDLAYRNVIYVALTRSSNEMIIINDEKTAYMDGWAECILLPRDIITINGQAPSNTSEFKCKCDYDKFSVTDSVGKLLVKDYKKYFSILSLESYRSEEDASMKLKVKTIINFGKISQNVSHIYGVLIPIVIEFHQTGRISFFEDADERGDKVTVFQGIKGYIKGKSLAEEAYEAYMRVKDHSRDLYSIVQDLSEDLAYLALHIINYKGYYNEFRQIRNWNWVDKEFILTSCSRMISFLSECELTEPLFEKPTRRVCDTLCIKDRHTGQKVQERGMTAPLRAGEVAREPEEPIEVISRDRFIVGRTDIICRDDSGQLNVVEVKVSERMDRYEYHLQVLVYAWMTGADVAILYGAIDSSVTVYRIRDKEKFNSDMISILDDILKGKHFISLLSSNDPCH
jgi:hypothetical protein